MCWHIDTLSVEKGKGCRRGTGVGEMTAHGMARGRRTVGGGRMA
jgi:hypothetical protein